MRALIWIIAIFAFAAGLAMFAGANEGYVLVVLPPWRLQASLNLAVVTLVVAFLALYLILRLIGRTLDLPGRVGAYRTRRRREKASRATSEAMRMLFEGRFGEALKQAKIAYGAGDGAAEAALVAARAAHGSRDERGFREWMAKAASADQGRTGALLTEAELAIRDQSWEIAAAALARLSKDGHVSSNATRLQLEVARGRGEWERVPELVRQLLGSRAISPEEARRRLREAHLGALAQRIDRPEDMADYWRRLGKENYADRELVTSALPLLMRAGKGAVARKVVERLLDEQWDSALAWLYAGCAGEGEEARDALQRSERWLNRHPDDAGLLYALGRQCVKAQLWGKAQSYLERSMALQVHANTHLALAEMFEATGQADQARTHYAQAARLAVG